jgi:hypothetical protein
MEHKGLRVPMELPVRKDRREIPVDRKVHKVPMV